MRGPGNELAESTGTKESDFNLNYEQKQQTSQEENFKDTINSESGALDCIDFLIHSKFALAKQAG